jgi:hypothetical protein
MSKTKTEDRTWDWKFRKDPVYCRAHGKRIIMFLNGKGGCRKCCDILIGKIEKKLEEKKK